MILRNTALFVLAGLLFSGCSTKLLQTEYEFKKKGEPQTVAIAVIADTQIHESRGEPSRPFGKAGDEFIAVTVRTAQQTVGQNDLLLRALEQSKARAMVLHLGDAMDVSCHTEWKDFTAVMQLGRGGAGPNTWVFAPGNHDGYMVGNLALEESGMYVRDYWRNVCNAGRKSVNNEQRFKHFPKNEMLKAYIQALGQTPPAKGETAGCSSDGALCWKAFIESEDLSYQSYIVQLLRLPAAVGSTTPIYALLLDSSNYSVRPYTMAYWAGIGGDMSVEQFQAAKVLVDTLPKEARFFMAAHHSMSSWNVRNDWLAEKKVGLEALLKDPRSLRFVMTAHTHEGGWFKHKSVAGDVVELNTGSLMDWPIYYRELAFEVDADGHFGVRTPLVNMKEAAANCTAKLACEADESCSVRDQAPDSTRATANRIMAALSSATKYAQNPFQAKHIEMDPQLLVYRDVAAATMPLDHVFEFEPYSGSNRKERFSREALLAEMTYMATGCQDNKEKLCSLQAKQNLLIELHKYYWEQAPTAVQAKAHEIRFCAALRASEESNDLLVRSKQQAGSILKDSERSVVRMPGGAIAAAK